MAHTQRKTPCPNGAVMYFRLYNHLHQSSIQIHLLQLRTLNKIIDRKTDTRTTVTSVKEDPLKVSAPIITLQYRGNASEWFAAKLRQNAGAQVIFTTRKLKTCLPSLKSPFAKDLKSRVVYKLTCSGCNSTYVGQTVRHLTTRIEEHHKEDSPVGQHLRECDRDGKSAELKSEIIDQSSYRSTYRNSSLWRPYIFGKNAPELTRARSSGAGS